MTDRDLLRTILDRGEEANRTQQGADWNQLIAELASETGTSINHIEDLIRQDAIGEFAG